MSDWQRSLLTTVNLEAACVSAWNKDPVFGVIGIQSGPRDKGPQWLPSSHGSRGWDAGGGDDSEDPSRLFCSWSAHQGDLPGAWRIAQGGPQGHPFGGDGVPVRARDAAASEDGPVKCRARPVAGGEREQDDARTANADPLVRRAPRPRI